MVPVTLHTHTSEGSPDASWSDADASAVYDARGVVSAVTDHDVRTPTRRLRGVERTIDAASTLHVVEVEGFRFLAHPALTFPRDTRARAAAYVRDHNLDGVEKYSRGFQQYTGTIDIPGVVELANDDAHNEWQACASYMLVDVSPGASQRRVLDEIRAGNVRLENPALDAVEYCRGRLAQGVHLARHAVRTAIGGRHG